MVMQVMYVRMVIEVMQVMLAMQVIQVADITRMRVTRMRVS